jgi:phosphate-selective porin OprO and OprP
VLPVRLSPSTRERSRRRWTNHAQMVDVGFNWDLNRFVKVYFDWERAIFGSPVFHNTGRFQKQNDLYWLRLQVLF